MAQSVDAKRNWYVSTHMASGFLLAHRTSLSAVAKDYTHTFLFEVGSKTFGRKAWQKVYNYPSLGMGYFHSSLSNNEILGKANALYGFVEVPYFLEKKWTICYQISFGLAYLSKKFDLYENIYNVAIGSHFNVFIRMAYDFKINIFRNSAILKTGVAFSHMSNSKIQTPNLGLNILDVHFALAYNLTPRKKTVVNNNLKRFKHTFAWVLAGGIKEFTTPLQGKYPAANVTFEYEYAFLRKCALGVGADLFYDGVIHEKMKRDLDDKAFTHANRLGVHVSYIHYFGKVGYLSQVGYYINPYYKGDLPYYFRIGLRAKVSKNLLVNLSMKTHLAKADILEIGLGYYFSRTEYSFGN